MIIEGLKRFTHCPLCGSQHFVEASEKSRRCLDCGFEFFMNPSAAVAAFLRNGDGQLLLTVREREPHKGTLDLPGGFCDTGENAEQAIAREIREETGINIHAARYLFSFPNSYHYSGIDIPTMDMFFECEAHDLQHVVARDDVAECRWMNPEDIDTQAIGLGSIRRAVEEYLRRLRASAIVLCAAVCLLTACRGEHQAMPAADNSATSDSLMDQVYALEDQNKYAEAISLVAAALQHLKQEKDSVAMADCYMEMAYCNQRLGNLQSAIETMQEGIRIDEQYKDLQRLSSDYNNLAACYVMAKHYEEAKTFIDKAINIEKQLEGSPNLTIRYGLASEIYVKLGLLDEALDFAQKACQLEEQTGDIIRMGRRLSQMANVYSAKQNFAQAEKLYLRSLKLLSTHGEKNSTCINFKQLGELYMNNGRNQEAAACLMKSYRLAHELQNKYTLEQVCGLLSKLYANSEPDMALKYLQEEIQLKDSISNEQTSQIMSSYAAQSESMEKANTIRQQQVRIANYRTITTIVVIFLVMLTTLCAALFYMFRERTRSRNILRRLAQMRNLFFTNITHEFRTPLTVINGLSRQLIDHPEMDNDKQVQCLTDIEKQGNSLLALVNELLEATKMLTGQDKEQWTRGNMVAYVGMVLETYNEFAATRNVTILYRPENKDIEAAFVGQYVTKIIRNLISNSIKHMPQGGTVTVELKRNARQLFLSVEDTGEGIPEDDLPNIFDLFYSGKNKALGQTTGIGLNFVKNMVEKMRGTITAENTGQGARFVVAMPLNNPNVEAYAWDGTIERAELRHPRLNGQDTPATQYRDTEGNEPEPAMLLVVEDNPDIARYIGMVTGRKYNTMFAANGEEALAKAQETMPDIILTDLMMDGMDGIELCKRVRANDILNHIPIIVITAKTEDADRLEALGAGADSFLVKPFNADELLLRTEKLLEQRKLLRQKFAYGLPGNEEYKEMREGEQLFLTRLTTTIHDNMSNSALNTAMLADLMHMTRTQLNGKTKAITGKTTNAYIQSVRMDRAARMLQQGTMPVGEIAMKCGYEDVSYFSRVFKQTTGITPSQFRKNETKE